MHFDYRTLSRILGNKAQLIQKMRKHTFTQVVMGYPTQITDMSGQWAQKKGTEEISWAHQQHFQGQPLVEDRVLPFQAIWPFYEGGGGVSGQAESHQGAFWCLHTISHRS